MKSLHFLAENVDTFLPGPYHRRNQGAFVRAAPDPLSGGVLYLILSAGPIAKAVLAVLAIFSIISWALIVEKWWQFRRVRRQTLAFLKVFREGRRAGVVAAAAKKLRES